MSEMKCRWVSSDQPRLVVGRHETTCAGETCSGCLPCVEPHCVVCRRAHAEGACAECVAGTRVDLREIGRLCDALPAEVEHRGVNGEAMMLLGPTADPATFGRRTVKLLAAGRCTHRQRGRECPDDQPLPAGPTCRDCDHPSCTLIRGDRYRCAEKVAWIEDARDEQHPLWVLGTWEQAWRDHLDQPTDLGATLPRLVDYLDRQLHVMADEGDVPFEDFARDLRRCRGHLEDVLRDGEQVETGAPCPKCGKGALVKSYGEDEAGDRWRCRNRECREWWTDRDYREKVGAAYERYAEALTASAIKRVCRVAEGTLRQWAARGKVRKRGRDGSGRMLYDVGDTLAMRDKETRESA